MCIYDYTERVREGITHTQDPNDKQRKRTQYQRCARDQFVTDYKLFIKRKGKFQSVQLQTRRKVEN